MGCGLALERRVIPKSGNRFSERSRAKRELRFRAKRIPFEPDPGHAGEGTGTVLSPHP